jgi:hypothetical protein
MAASLGVSFYTVESWRKEVTVGQSSVGKNVSTEADDILGIRHQATTD